MRPKRGLMPNHKEVNMHNLKRKLAAALSTALAVAMISPMAVGPVKAKTPTTPAPPPPPVVNQLKVGHYMDNVLEIKETAGETDTLAETQSKVYVETTIGSKAANVEIFPAKTDRLDLSYLKGKAGSVTIILGTTENTRDYQKKTITVDKRHSMKASFDIENCCIKAEVDGSTDVSADSKLVIDINGVKVYGAARDPENSGELVNNRSAYEPYFLTGATAKVYYEGHFNDDKTEFTPNTKIAKVKIPVRKSGPTIRINPYTLSFKLPKGCVVSLSYGADKVVTDQALTKAKTIDIQDLVDKMNEGVPWGTNNSASNTKSDWLSLAGQNTTDNKWFVLEVYKQAEGKSLETKHTEVVLPDRIAYDCVSQAGVEGLSFEQSLSKDNTKQNGILFKNASSSAIYEVAIVPDEYKLPGLLKSWANDLNEKIDNVPFDDEELYVNYAINLDLTPENKADDIKWTVVKPGKKVVVRKDIQGKPIKDGQRVIYRLKGKKEIKNKQSLVFSSEIAMASTTTVVRDQIKGNLGVTVQTTGAADNVSGVSIIVANKESTEDIKYVYWYEVGSKVSKVSLLDTIDDHAEAFKTNKLDKKEEDSLKKGGLGSACRVEAAKKQYITVYEANEKTGEIISYKSVKVSAVY